jgi:hypothetical protein
MTDVDNNPDLIVACAVGYGADLESIRREYEAAEKMPRPDIGEM